MPSSHDSPTGDEERECFLGVFARSGKPAGEVEERAPANCRADLRHRRLRPAERDVLRDRPGEQEALLGNDPELPAQRALRDVAEVVAVDEDPTLARVVHAIDALAEERDQDEKIWGSMVKQTLKRRNPGFNESYYGFRTFSDLLEEAQQRRLLTLEPDQKSGGYIIKRVAA